MLKMLGYDITEEEYILLLNEFVYKQHRSITKEDLFDVIPRLKE